MEQKPAFNEPQKCCQKLLMTSAKMAPFASVTAQRWKLSTVTEVSYCFLSEVVDVVDLRCCVSIFS